ncbi:hypothetical protein FACS1894120_6230 [Clostridia bacterium]|nr:hypothetical protein FACS1894120_6230 [Clostridia bacterium]
MDIKNTHISAYEIDVLKHTIGLQKNRKKQYEPYRNYYNISPGCDGYKMIQSLCERGFMRLRAEDSFAVTTEGENFLENVLGIEIMHRPRYEKFPTLKQDLREHYTCMQNRIYCPHCGNFPYNGPYEDIAHEFDYESVLGEDHNTLEYDIVCDTCGKTYHLNVDAEVQFIFTTTCEKEE